MSLEYAEGWLRRIGDDQLADRALGLREAVVAEYGQDVPHENVIFRSREQPILDSLIEAYREATETNTLTPEIVNATWHSFWRVKADAAQLEIPLYTPVCDRTS